jgi:hypothetical protein
MDRERLAERSAFIYWVVLEGRSFFLKKTPTVKTSQPAKQEVPYRTVTQDKVRYGTRGLAGEERG